MMDFETGTGPVPTLRQPKPEYTTVELMAFMEDMFQDVSNMEDEEGTTNRDGVHLLELWGGRVWLGHSPLTLCKLITLLDSNSPV